MQANNLQELANEYEYLRQEVSAIDNQIRELQNHHNSLLLAKESIDSIKNKNGAEILVPGGAGVYFYTSLSNDKSCLVEVGSNIFIEMNIIRAKKTISERIDQVLKMIVQLNEEADAIVNRLQQIEQLINTQAK